MCYMDKNCLEERSRLNKLIVFNKFKMPHVPKYQFIKNFK